MFVSAIWLPTSGLWSLDCRHPSHATRHCSFAANTNLPAYCPSVLWSQVVTRHASLLTLHRFYRSTGRPVHWLT